MMAMIEAAPAAPWLRLVEQLPRREGEKVSGWLAATSQNSGSAAGNAEENVWSDSNCAPPTPNGWAPRKALPTLSGH